MKFTLAILAAVTVAIAPQGARGQFSTRLGGVNTAGWDFSVVSALDLYSVFTNVRATICRTLAETSPGLVSTLQYSG